MLNTESFLLGEKSKRCSCPWKKWQKDFNKLCKLLSSTLLPISGQIFERLIYNKLYEYFIENELISSGHYGFKAGGMCIHNLLSVIHDIYQSFDNDFEVTCVCLDISKAFRKV